jgi:methylenetetrahydrofolate dehydrogenase (NADP+) / methenyltetrahydrofolate cyclohydrolase
MSAQILDGKVLAANLKEELKAQINTLKNVAGKNPRIISIVVGDDAASSSYALSQQKAAEGLGINYELRRLDLKSTQDDITALIRRLNDDTSVHGVIVNKPVPSHLNFQKLIDTLYPEKDIEGVTFANLGRLFLGQASMFPCTPAAAMEHIKSTGVGLKGKEAVVLGRSEIVGKPLAMLLLKENATVTVCHSGTHNLPDVVRRADIVIAAVGKKHFVQGDWIKPGAIVIDVGINDDNGKIAGDVDYQACLKNAAYITPVPGGVGPVTAVMLMRNAVRAFKNQLNII